MKQSQLKMGIPALGFGTFKVAGDDAKRMVSHALDVGYRHIDTAQIYGNERAVGDGIKKSNVARADIFLTTKIWVDNYQPEQFAASLAESLKSLQTDYVDLLLLHWPSENVPLEAQISGLNLAREAGFTRHIGVSNFTTGLMKQAVALSDAPIMTNQIEYHPFLSQKRVQDAAKPLGMSVTAFFGMANGKVFETPLIQEIAAQHNRSVAQIVLRWLIQQDNIIALSKTLSEQRAIENFAVFDFDLTDHEMKSINSLAVANERFANPEGLAPLWDENI